MLILTIKTYINNLCFIHNFEKSFFTLFNLNDAKYPNIRVNNDCNIQVVRKFD